MCIRQLIYAGAIFTWASVFLLTPAAAQAGCEPEVGRFISITGAVAVQSGAGSKWVEADLSHALCEGDSIRVGDRSRAAVSLINDAVLRIDQNTAMRLLDITDQEAERSWLEVLKGAFQSFSRKPSFLTVNTPYLNGSIEGTEFVVRVDEQATSITVFEGVVVAANDQGEVALNPGESAQAAKGQAPQRRTVVRPRDRAQWALYYPPLVAAPTAAPGSSEMSKAKRCAADGDTVCAFAALDAVPASARDAQFFSLRAATLLSVGRVDAARVDIDEMLRRDPTAGEGYALRSVIAVALNDNATALADGRRAVELSPDSAAAKIALSYALQANLQLDEARDTLLQAVDRQPDDALAWARLAELHLMLGDRSEATAAAERAVALQPGLSRAQNVLGFAALAEIRIEQAREAFERAIALDSADPLPRLGLGLTKIRRGQLDEGRADLEAAVALDSNNALLRAYLGKAYFEERRGPLDGQQLDIAKELDPLDPTAYFYNAVRLQTENQPVDALGQLDASMERNDNRAVYRGRLLLDQDRAARGASQARVYNNLGFTQSGLGVATRSLTLDPSNASAHRFLSDTYSTVRRREISRVSNLLQAQMLQDININPVQPSVSETNLNTVTRGGPSSVGYNEFTPLFESDGVQLNVTGAIGNNDTLAGEGVLSAIYDRFSISAGGYHYESDGWRRNNGMDQDIYNIYAQAAITPQLNVQAEFRHRESTEGDLAFNFDRESLFADKSVDREQDTARVGLRYSPNAESDLLLSYIHSDNEEKQRQVEESQTVFGLFTTTVEAKGDADGDQIEGQYIFKQERFNLVAGLAHSDVDTEKDVFIESVNPFFASTVSDLSDGEITHNYGYLYGNVNLTDAVTATLGVSYHDYEEQQGAIRLDESGFDPKAGVQWQVNEALTLRAAAFKAFKPPLVNNRTLEPTQVAGFNQFFDDRNAAKTKGYGVGGDLVLSKDLIVGGEVTWRDLDDPVFDVNRAVYEDRDEDLHRAYVYWTPTQRVSVTAEFVYDLYKAEQGTLTRNDNLPETVETYSLPIGVRYFAPSGLFAGVGGTYVEQKVDRSTKATQGEGRDSFFLVDLALGYRLPKRAGIVSLEIKNAFDEEFNYQDDSYREFRDQPSTGPYYPERTLMGQVLLSF